MIVKVSGELEGFSDRGVYLRVGGLVYEVLLTAIDRREMEACPTGESLTLHTLYFIEGGVGGGSLTPTLVGFKNESDREFFQLFTRVEGIGISNALRMLDAPIHRVAQAIEEQDLKFLCSLKQVGERTARKIVASMLGKVAPFRLPEREAADRALKAGSPAPAEAPDGSWEALQEEARIVLEQLGYSPAEARRLLDRAAEQKARLRTLQDLLDEIYGARK